MAWKRGLGGLGPGAFCLAHCHKPGSGKLPAEKALSPRPMTMRSAPAPRHFLAGQAAGHPFNSALATGFDFQEKIASSAVPACVSSSYFNSKIGLKPIAFGTSAAVSFSEKDCTKIKNRPNCKRTWMLRLGGEAQSYQKLNDCLRPIEAGGRNEQRSLNRWNRAAGQPFASNERLGLTSRVFSQLARLIN